MNQEQKKELQKERKGERERETYDGRKERRGRGHRRLHRPRIQAHAVVSGLMEVLRTGASCTISDRSKWIASLGCFAVRLKRSELSCLSPCSCMSCSSARVLAGPRTCSQQLRSLRSTALEKFIPQWLQQGMKYSCTQGGTLQGSP